MSRRPSPIRAVRQMLTGLVVALALAASAVSTSFLDAKSATAASADYSRDVSLNDNAYTGMMLIQRRLGSRPEFAGVWIAKSGIMLGLTSRLRSGDARVIDAARSSAPVTVIHEQNSLQDLSRVQRSINGRDQSLIHQGIPLREWGVLDSANKIEIKLRHYSPNSERILVKQFGARFVFVAKGDFNPQDSSRRSDYSPFYGGLVMYKKESGAVCTSWFGTTSVAAPSHQYVLTAGHCSTGHWYVYNLSGNYIGYTNSLHRNSKVDAQDIRDGAAPYVWTTYQNDPIGNRYAAVVGVQSNGVGELVCTDGVTDGEQCSVQVTQINVSRTYDGGPTITDCIEGSQEYLENAFSPGDSGGPVYQYVSGSTSRLYARRMVVYHESHDYQGYFTPAFTTAAQMGVSIMTTSV